MTGTGDATGVLAWGIRRYIWIVVLCVAALGLLIPSVIDRVPDQYEAQAQVGPAGNLKLSNLDPLPRLGESVFNNGVVAQSVREALDPPAPPDVSVIPERVELVAPQDNIVFSVVGRGPDAASAQAVANVAAATFTNELNKYTDSVGPFAIQRLATRPSEPVTRLAGSTAIAIGTVSGLAAGVGLVALLLIWRRPIVTVGAAEEASGAPVLGRVVLGSRDDASGGMTRLCRRALATPIDVLLLLGTRRSRGDRQDLAGALAQALTTTHEVAVLPSGRTEPDLTRVDGAGHLDRLTVLTDPATADLVGRSERSLLLLVVRRGTPYAALHRQAEMYLDDGAVGVVLVHRRRRLLKPVAASFHALRLTRRKAPSPQVRPENATLNDAA
jgi:hypothetical protein